MNKAECPVCNQKLEFTYLIRNNFKLHISCPNCQSKLELRENKFLTFAMIIAIIALPTQLIYRLTFAFLLVVFYYPVMIYFYGLRVVDDKTI